MKPAKSQNKAWIHRFLDLPHTLIDNPDIVCATAYAIGAVLSSHWAATMLHHAVAEPRNLGPWAWGAIWAVLALSFTILVWWHRHSFRELRCHPPVPASTARKECLVFFISDQKLLRPELAIADSGPLKILKPAFAGQPAVEVAIERRSLRDDIPKLDPLAWNWQQILRGLEPHVEPRPSRLRRVYLIGSASTQSDLATCKSFINPYLDGSVQIETWADPVDFENVVAIDAALRAVIRHAVNNEIPMESICVDVTGGQKPTSIAGAIVTLNRPVTIQYVPTFSKTDKQAMIYDMRFLGPAEQPEGGHN